MRLQWRSLAREKYKVDSIPNVKVDGVNRENEIVVCKLNECMSDHNNRFPELLTGKLADLMIFGQENHHEVEYMLTHDIF